MYQLLKSFRFTANANVPTTPKGRIVISALISTMTYHGHLLGGKRLVNAEVGHAFSNSNKPCISFSYNNIVKFS